jgi:hypothetical protein
MSRNPLDSSLGAGQQDPEETSGFRIPYPHATVVATGYDQRLAGAPSDRHRRHWCVVTVWACRHTSHARRLPDADGAIVRAGHNHIDLPEASAGDRIHAVVVASQGWAEFLERLEIPDRHGVITAGRREAGHTSKLAKSEVVNGPIRPERRPALLILLGVPRGRVRMRAVIREQLDGPPLVGGS